MTMNDTWGFKKNDHNWKSVETLTRNLIDIASKGGNYLLNVGPTAAGEIPAASVERLAGIGQWMKANGESIYATKASPFAKTPWGRCTQKSLDGKTRLYLHVFDWPADGKLVVPAKGKPAGARLLAGGARLDAAAEDGAVTITLPQEAPSKIATVVVLDVE
jgi:alpha-L-fucosidase